MELTESQIAGLVLDSADGPTRLDQLFQIDLCFSNEAHTQEPQLILRGNLQRFDRLCQRTSSGTTVVCGAVGDDFASTQSGGVIYIDGSVGQRAFADKRDGLCIVRGDAADRFGCPLPGKLQGIQGGDSIVLGNLGHRACERMRRGTLLVGGNIGQNLANQWIAGTILAMQDIGPYWATHMRRGSLIFQSQPTSHSGASLSRQRPLELSFLPILWAHLRGLLAQAAICENLSASFQSECRDLGLRLPKGRQVLRSIGDIECDGQGEVLVLQNAD